VSAGHPQIIAIKHRTERFRVHIVVTRRWFDLAITHLCHFGEYSLKVGRHQVPNRVKFQANLVLPGWRRRSLRERFVPAAANECCPAHRGGGLQKITAERACRVLRMHDVNFLSR
jgi:hypothetical protein